jgi:hypothetical protein
MGMTLKHIPGQLDDRHPAAGRDVHCTNDFDVALRNAVRPNSPPGVDHMMAVRRALLKEKLDRWG